MARPPGAMEQAGILRQLAGARSLSPFIRNGDSGQTDPCFPSLTGFKGKDYGVDLPVAAYVTVPRSIARRALICSPPKLRTIGNSSGVGVARETKGQKLRSRRSLALPSTFSRIAGSGNIRAISIAPIIVEKMAKKARSLSALRRPGMNGTMRTL